MLYFVQRTDCDRFTLAGDIDPAYAAAYQTAAAQGVEVLCLGTNISPRAVQLGDRLRIEL
jgi:sugar fermentation stimulation protein A